jgi:lysocardiolipin and lysophospholipid acyltransferase
MFLQGRTTPSVNMHWRRFHTSTIPKDAKEFDNWLQARWREKDDLLEYYANHNRFPADEEIEHIEIKNGAGIKEPKKGCGYIETHVKPKNPFEFLTIFAPVGAALLIGGLFWRWWKWLLVVLGRS